MVSKERHVVQIKGLTVTLRIFSRDVYTTNQWVDHVPHITSGQIMELRSLIPAHHILPRLYGMPTGLEGKRLKEIATSLASASKDKEAVANLSRQDQNILSETLLTLGHRNLQSKYFELYPDEGPLRRSLYGKHMEHYGAGVKYRERTVMGGNRTGKTVEGAFETTAHLTGIYRDWWPGRIFNEPTRCLVAGKTNGTLKSIIQRELFGGSRKQANGKYQLNGTGMIPNDLIYHDSAAFKSGVPGVVDEIEIQYRDSKIERSILYMKAYEQGRGVFEGAEFHFGWLDEEPPIEIYGEVYIRLATLDGLLALTYTPLDGMTELVTSFLPSDMRPVESGDSIDEISAD